MQELSYRILLRGLTGARLSLLEVRDTALLAAFTFMKAVVTDYMIDYEPFFTRAARENFRKTLTVPPQIKMWFAAFEGDSRFSTGAHFEVHRPHIGPLAGIEFGSFTYILGKLTLQLSAPRWQDVRDRWLPVVTLTPDAYWDCAAVKFFPYAGYAVSWPPPKHFRDDTIQLLIDRFGNPIRNPWCRL